MTITPSDSLDLLIARGPPDATDFAKQIAGLPGAYYAGLDEAYKRRTQDAFQGGVPTTASGQVDLPSIYKTLLQTGGTPAGIEVAKGLQAQETQKALQSLSGVFGGNSDQSTTIPGAPPSTANTTTLVPPAAPRIPSIGEGQSITGIISPLFSGPNADRVAAAVSRRFGVDQTQQLSPQQVSDVQQYVQQIPRQPQQPPQATAAPPSAVPSAEGMASVTNDPTLGGLIPPGRTVEQHKALLARAAALAESAQRGAGKPYLDALDAIQKRLQPTEEQKNYLANKQPGETEAQYKARTAATTETAKGVAGLGVDMLKSAQAGYTSAQNTKYGLDLIDHSIGELGPSGWMGTAAGTRLEIAKGFNSAIDSLGLPQGLKFDASKIANLEDFNKQSLKLGFETAKTLGSREAMQIVQQATKSVPNFEQSPLGAKLVSSSLRQGAQRSEDFYRFIARPENQGRVGADIDFNRLNPPEKYSTIAIANSGIPMHLGKGDEQKVGWLPPKTKYFWNGKPWTKD